MQTALTWQVTETDGYETSWVTLDGRTLTADGRTFGRSGAAGMQPWWAEYELSCGDDFVTRQLLATVYTPQSTLELDLRRTENGTWTVNGVETPELAGALDCDVAFSPLTNAMPILRWDLHKTPGVQQFRIAFVSLPDLAVSLSEQTYTHLGTGRVRFQSGSYVSDLTVDGNGLVVAYPGMALRL
jgi:hypothetical protein